MPRAVQANQINIFVDKFKYQKFIKFTELVNNSFFYYRDFKLVFFDYCIK